MNRLIKWTLAALAILMVAPALRADIDKKLYQRAAKYVWDTPSPTFTVTADLSDSIYRDQSAVYIARSFDLNANYDSSPDVSKMTIFGYNTSNAIKAVLVRRSMVKLYDAAALEHFTDFTVQAPTKEAISGYTVVKVEPAFGARIYKPDGSMREVDMSQALTITKGKKNQDDEYKIAIPGLEAGDILDYFYYTEYFLDEISMPVVQLNLLLNYPTRSLTIKINSSPELAVEYGAFNGAPDLPPYTMADGRCITSVTLDNLEAFPDKTDMTAPARQIPYYKFYCLNNRARLEFVPASARAGGIRRVNTAFFNSDVASMVNKTKEPSSLINAAEKVYNGWLEAHPDATERERIDALWLSVNYTGITSDESYQLTALPIAFYRLLQKTGCTQDFNIAYTSSRQQPSVRELASFKEADFLVNVGDMPYFATGTIEFLPGEILPDFDGEPTVVFRGDPANTSLQSMTVPGRIPAAYARNNTADVTVQLSLDPANDENILIDADYNFGGAAKGILNPLVMNIQKVNALAAYLGQNTDKLFKKYDSEGAKSAIDERVEQFVKQVWAADQVKVSDYQVLECGTSPDQPNINVRIEGSVEGAVSTAGNDLLVNLGRFIGKQSVYEGKQRTRDISIVRSYPVKAAYTLHFKVPDGYTVVEESLENFNNNIKTKEMMLTSSATYADGVVSVEVVERYNYSIMEADKWATEVAIADALAGFNKASLVLRPQ